MTKKKVEELITYWVDVLELKDWTYKGINMDKQVVPDRPEVKAAVGFDFYDKVFHLNLARDVLRMEDAMVEFVVVHELMHIFVYPFDFIMTMYEDALELDPEKNQKDKVLWDIRYKELEVILNKMARLMQAAYGKYK